MFERVTKRVRAARRREGDEHPGAGSIRRAGQGFEASGLVVTALSLAFNAEELVLHVSAVWIQAADDLTVMQQQDPISHSGHLIKMLAGHQDRDSVFTGARPQQLADPYHPKRVEAVAGFIQNQHIWLMNQCHSDPKTLPIAQ